MGASLSASLAAPQSAKQTNVLATKGRNGQPDETEKWITGEDPRVPLIASVGPQGTLKRKQARFLDEAKKQYGTSLKILS